MTFSGIKYLIKQGLKSMRANRMMTVASIGVLTACLFVTGAAALLSLNVNSCAEYLVGRSEIIVYLWDTEEQANQAQNPQETPPETKTPINSEAVRAEINKLSNIKSCEFISKEQALAEVGEMLEEYKNLLQDYENGVRDNPVPANFRIKVNDLHNVRETAQQLEKLHGVQKVSSPNDLAIILLNIKAGVNYAGWGLVAVLGLVGLVVISNTIRLTVFARRKEINIMKFVGATNTFIRMPFFVEGIATGLISAALSFGLLSGGYVLVCWYLQQNTAQSNAIWLTAVKECLIPYSQIWPFMLLAVAAVGVVIGGLGSAFSVRKHLKV